MIASDFYFDGLKLSDFDCMICQFDGGGVETVSAGSNVELTTVSFNHGAKTKIVDSKYSEMVSFTFQMCKTAGGYFDVDEYAEIMRWLVKKYNCEFKLIDGYWDDITFYGTMNVQQIMHYGKLAGFEITFTADAPYGYKGQVSRSFTLSANGTYDILVDSDEEGPLSIDKMTITCTSAGTLKLTNSQESRTTQITNCTSGEVITIYGTERIISTSDGTHSIMNNFNFVFPRLNTTYKNKKNTIRSSLPCSIEILYTPIKKVAIG